MPSSTSRALATFLVASFMGGCAELHTSYRCGASDECTSPTGGEVGTCEPNGFCSFADPACPTGRRYGEHVDNALAGDCVVPLVAFRAATSTSLATGTSLTIDVPAAAREGDLLWLALFATSQDVALTPPGGWTPFADLRGVGLYHVWWFQRALAAGDPATVSVDFAASVVHSAILAAYANVAAADPIDGQIVDNVVGNPFVATSLETTVTNAMLVLTVANEAGDGESWSAPAGMTLRGDTGYLALFDQPAPDAGATGDRRATCSLGGEGSVAFVALRPGSP